MESAINTEAPLISFVITVKNLAKEAVRSTIKSITELSLRPDEREIIVIDDGSDESVINSLGDVKDDFVYVRQRSQGISVARNIGIHIASGLYVQLLEGGDRLIGEGYEHCIDIVRYNNPDIVLFDFTDKRKFDTTYYIPDPVDGTVFMRNNDLNVMAWCYVFRKNMLLDLRFTPDRINDDEEFTPQLFLRAENVYSTNIPAYYRCHHEDLSMKRVDKRLVLKRLNDMEQVLVHLHDVSTSLPRIEFHALQRRIAQFTLEYIFRTIRFTHSSHQLEERLERLEKIGLFPLPDKDYTKRYMLLRKFANNKFTRKMLTLVLR